MKEANAQASCFHCKECLKHSPQTTMENIGTSVELFNNCQEYYDAL